MLNKVKNLPLNQRGKILRLRLRLRMTMRVHCNAMKRPLSAWERAMARSDRVRETGWR
jgi:hypothetical protein